MKDPVAIAHETLNALKKGQYVAPSGGIVPVDYKACMASTKFYSPSELNRFAVASIAVPAKVGSSVSLVRETTLAGAERLSRAFLEKGSSAPLFKNVGVLNFASARHPGGGFLEGSIAQEESLVRSSALYPSLTSCPQYYDAHRSGPASYTDSMIVSPSCPVFVDDAGNFLEEPYSVTFITSAAPNAGVMGSSRDGRSGLSSIRSILLGRAAKVLAAALHHGVDAMILGAWGCGVFRNDPYMVADVFKHLLASSFENKFVHVLFSVYDPSRDSRIYKPFEDAFGARDEEAKEENQEDQAN